MYKFLGKLFAQFKNKRLLCEQIQSLMSEKINTEKFITYYNSLNTDMQKAFRKLLYNAGFSRSTVYAWINGDRTPRVSTAKLIALTLCINYNELFS